MRIDSHLDLLETNVVLEKRRIEEYMCLLVKTRSRSVVERTLANLSASRQMLKVLEAELQMKRAEANL
jgi:hypothetical protein